MPGEGFSVETLSGLTKRQILQRRQKKLWDDRSLWDKEYQLLADFFSPRSVRFEKDQSSDQQRGRSAYSNIYDSTTLRARRVLNAGLMSGVTSPAREWVRLALPDRDLMEFKPVQMWLSQSTRLMHDIFRASNLYQALPPTYNNLSVFGTACAFQEPDFDNVIHLFPTAVGEFALAQTERGVVDTIVRRFRMYAVDMARKFGVDALSPAAKRAVDNGNLWDRIPVVHVVQPNDGRDQRMLDNRNMAFESVWFEESGDTDEQLLRQSGYRSFPGLTPRWSRPGGDVYGDSAGMEALGDSSQLMHEQLRKAQAIDYQTNPPLQVPTAYKGQQVNRFPGGVMYVDAVGQNNRVSTAFDVNLRLDYLLADIQDIRTRINESFFVDLFLMIAQVERSNVTAREIAEKQEEKLLMLGPVLQALDNELLEPLVNFTFDRMVETKILPPPPPELEGMPLSIEFMGILAQAQRAVGISQVDRMIGTVTAVSQLKPETLDKLDTDQIVDVYADMLGVDPSIIVADEDVAIVREQRAQAQQEAMAVEQGKTVADTAKTLSETDPGGDSMLAAMTGNT